MWIASRAYRLLLLLVFPVLVPAQAQGPSQKPNTNLTNVTAELQAKEWHDDRLPTESVCAVMIGGVVFVMSLTYLVHWPDSDIRLVAWKLISSTLSIFVAVMMNTVLVTLALKCLASMLSTSWCCAMLLVLLWMVVQASLFQRRKNKLGLVAGGTLGGHILGFTAIEVFGCLQGNPPFDQAIWLAVLVLPIFFVVWAVFSFIAFKVRSRVEDKMEAKYDHDESEVEAEEEWEDTCQESENDAVCITLGFLLTQVVSFAIVGELPPADGEPLVHTAMQNHLLFAAAVSFLLAVFIFEVADHDLNGKLTKRFYAVTRGVLSMGMSWCWLFWGRWHLWKTVQMEELMAKVVLAGSTSLFCILMVFVCDKLADWGMLNPRALRALVQAFGLLIGFAWEACFEAVMEDLHPTSTRTLCAVGLVIFVLPGWRLYILPRAMEAWHQGLADNPPPPTALCFADGTEELLSKLSSEDSEE